MQKIKCDLYNLMITSDLTRLELRFLFYLAARCDETGRVDGVYYAELAADIDCSVAKFYHLRDDLTKKGFIVWEKNTSADIDFQLMGNSFYNGNNEIEYRDYVDINIAIFHDPEFFELKAGAIRVAMELVKRVAANEAVTAANSMSWKADGQGRILFSPFNEYRKLAKLLGVSNRVVGRYFELLAPWFQIQHGVIGDTGRKYDVITVLKSAITYGNLATDKINYKFDTIVLIDILNIYELTQYYSIEKIVDLEAGLKRCINNFFYPEGIGNIEILSVKYEEDGLELSCKTDNCFLTISKDKESENYIITKLQKGILCKRLNGNYINGS